MRLPVIQTGPQVDSPIPGKKMNCLHWGSYVLDDESDPKKGKELCHGGRYDGFDWLPCPARQECEFDLKQKRRGRVTLAETYELRAKSTTPSNDVATSRHNTLPAVSFEPRKLAPMPTTLPTVPAVSGSRAAEAYNRLNGASAPQGVQVPQATIAPRPTTATIPPPMYGLQFPQAVIPPSLTPPGMRTPYASIMPVQGEVAPTFLPREGERIVHRLGKNILQGMIAALGWVIWNFCRTVDLFG